MSDEWGPWIEHDGKGCPGIPDRTWINIVGVNFDGTPHNAEGLHESRHEDLPQWSWALWNDPLIGQIHRYRIRKPRGMVVLERMLAELPVKEGERV